MTLSSTVSASTLPHHRQHTQINQVLLALPIFLFLLATLYIPLAGLPYVLDSLSGDPNRIVDRSFVHSNLAMALAKDVLVALVICFYTVHRLYPKKHLCCARQDTLTAQLSCLMAVVVTYLLACSLVSWIFLGSTVALAGSRFVEFILLGCVSYGLTRLYPALSAWFLGIIKLIFWIEWSICVLQTRLMWPSEGVTLLGSRVLGSFNNPNTIGLLFSLCVLIFLFFEPGPLFKKLWYVGCGILGTLMSGSRASLLIALFFAALFAWLHLKNRSLKLILAAGSLLGLFVLIPLLPTLSGRKSQIHALGDDPRWGIFYDTLKDSSFSDLMWGKGLGNGSNTLGILTHTIPNYFSAQKAQVFIMDSTYTVLLFQLGIVGLSLYLFTLLYLVRAGDRRSLVLVLFVLAVGASTVWLEMYPINFLVCSLFGILLATNPHTLEGNPNRKRLSQESRARDSKPTLVFLDEFSRSSTSPNTAVLNEFMAAKQDDYHIKHICFSRKHAPGGLRPKRLWNMAVMLLATPFILLWVKTCYPRAFVVVSTSPPGLHLLACLLGALFRQKVVVWLFDAHPEIECLMLDKYGLRIVSYGLRKLESLALNQAAVIVCLDTAMKQRLLPFLAHPERIVLCPPWSAYQTPAKPFAPRVSQGLHFVYAGNYGKIHCLRSFVGFIKQFSPLQQAQISIDFIGLNAESTAAIQHLFQPTKCRIHFLGRKKNVQEVIALFPQYDFGIVCLNAFYNGLGCPSKALTYVSQGLPLYYTGPSGNLSASLCQEGYGIDHQIFTKSTPFEVWQEHLSAFLSRLPAQCYPDKKNADFQALQQIMHKA